MTIYNQSDLEDEDQAYTFCDLAGDFVKVVVIMFCVVTGLFGFFIMGV
jgi:hypothetical protein